MTHGRYSAYKTLRLGALIELYKDDPEPLNVLEELATARALFAAYVERNRAVFESGTD